MHRRRWRGQGSSAARSTCASSPLGPLPPGLPGDLHVRDPRGGRAGSQRVPDRQLRRGPRWLGGLSGVSRRCRGAAAGAGAQVPPAADRPARPQAAARRRRRRRRTGGSLPRAGRPPRPRCRCPRAAAPIRDIGEKFSVSAATGTASLTIPRGDQPRAGGLRPVAEPAATTRAPATGRSAWAGSSSCPAITRKTDKGLPRYLDDPDVDTFILAGAEDLVPIRAERDGGWREVPARRAEDGRDYLVQGYRPRVEGLFARIERWRDLGTGETHWRRSRSANVTTVYGATAASRIADPADPSRVFSWLISATYDDTGNAAVYDYVAEDSAGVDTARPSESNRTARSRSANRYLKRIRYGNREPWRPGAGADPPGPGTRRRLALRGRLRLRRPPAGRPGPRARPGLACPQRPVLHLPARLRGAHLPPVPPGAHVPPLPWRARRRARTAWCPPPTWPTRAPAAAA